MLKARDEEIVIVGAARTPVGAYLGDLKTVPVEDLGQIALEEALKRSNVSKEDIDEVIVGHVTGSQTTNNLGRIIGINSGLPDRSTGMTINRICGSGIQSAVSAVESILLGHKNIIASGGAESLSRAPYYLPESVRYKGFRMGDKQLIDANLEGHRSSSGKDSDVNHMGETAENVVEKYSITREAQDEFALNSQRKATEAMESGRFADEIVPVEVKGRKGDVTVVDKDGHIRPNTDMEKLSKLSPAFREGGTVTAGNSSGLNDGGAFEIFMTESNAKERNLDIMGQVVDYSIVGCAPEYMGLGPVEAIKNVLSNNDMDLEDLDILEINEAFAGQTLGVLHELDIDTDSDFYKNKFNPRGGAVALGHPLGMTGARILTTILYEFKKHPEKKYAIASACIGGGQGIAMLLKNGHSE